MATDCAERTKRFDEILTKRRRTQAFRWLVVFSVAWICRPVVGPVATWAWAAICGTLQFAEWFALAPHRRGFVATHVGYWASATLLSLSAVAYGAISLLWALRGDAWGLAMSAVIVMGSMMHSLTTTATSPMAFRIQIYPMFAYAGLLPIVAYFKGAPTSTVIGLLGGVAIATFMTHALWRQAHETWTREKAALAEVERRRAEAEAATAAKSAFMAVISHELRTPISAIVAGAMDCERHGDARTASSARLVAEAGAMMRTLLDDLLDFAKLEAGHMTIETIAYDFRGLVAGQLRFWQAEARKKGVRLRLEGAAQAPRHIVSDPTRLRQILNNLLSNALKFTPHGSITIRLASELRDDRWRIGLTIEDTGEGMTPEQIARLFTAFQQSDDTVARRHGGTGLGLAISRELARMMGGDIQVRSQAGRGSCFEVTLVAGMATAPDQTPPAATAQMLDGPAILVVDDHQINRQALSLMLEPLGATPDNAVSGQDALRRLAQRPYDLVLMDVNMPEMTGPQTVRRLRRAAGPNQFTPVIAVTGAVDERTLDECLASGMNDWIAKPIDVGQLYAAMGRVAQTANIEPSQT